LVKAFSIEQKLRNHAASLLQAYLRGDCIKAFLRDLPLYQRYQPGVALNDCIAKFRCAVQTLLPLLLLLLLLPPPPPLLLLVLLVLVLVLVLLVVVVV